MPPVCVLGVPSRYIPHGKPDRILAELGLPPAGIDALLDAKIARQLAD